MARNPHVTWDLLNQAMSHFQIYISTKTDRYALSIIDLLHVSNFKGGNASITEPPQSLCKKLSCYETALRSLGEKYGESCLAKLNQKQTCELKKLCTEFLAFPADANFKIRGFGPSYASALLAAYFPNLVPVLDRRALNGAKINVMLDSQGQVKNIASHYGELIEAFQHELVSTPALTLRQLDKLWFSTHLPPLQSHKSASPLSS
jgi:hypothetical protein